MHLSITALHVFGCLSSVYPYTQRRHGLYSIEVPVSGRAGVPDHLPGAHHEILPHPAG